MRQSELDTLRSGDLIRPKHRNWEDLHEYLCRALPDQPPVCLVVSVNTEAGTVAITGLARSGQVRIDTAMFYDVIEDSFDYQDPQEEAIKRESRLSYTSIDMAANWYRVRGHYDTASWLEEQSHQTATGNGFIQTHGSHFASLNSPRV